MKMLDSQLYLSLVTSAATMQTGFPNALLEMPGLADWKSALPWKLSYWMKKFRVQFPGSVLATQKASPALTTGAPAVHLLLS